jgi:RNA polymerase sigma-70 factor (ECF subfamily)
MRGWFSRIGHGPDYLGHLTAWRQRSFLLVLCGAHVASERVPLDDAEAPVGASPEEAALDRLTLGDALARLSTKHRVALHLVFAQGFTAQEAAQILGVPVRTVKSRVSFARRALQSALGRRSSEDGDKDGYQDA